MPNRERARVICNVMRFGARDGICDQQADKIGGKLVSLGQSDYAPKFDRETVGAQVGAKLVFCKSLKGKGGASWGKLAQVEFAPRVMGAKMGNTL